MKKNLHFSSKGMGRDIALSFLGTTLSIVLTFGSSAIYEHLQQKKAQRLTTMMIVHDMDASVAKYQRWLDEETKSYDAARYVLLLCDEIDSLPIDTVMSAFYYLVDYNTFSFDDSKEKIFNSGYESWNNIDNAMFVDLVQEFYFYRRDYKEMILNSMSFKKPFSKAEFDSFYVQRFYNRDITEQEYREILKEKIKAKEVIFYINQGPNRKRVLTRIVAHLKNCDDRCKFLMNITDEELNEFVKNMNSRGRTLKKKNVPGQWNLNQTSNNIRFFDFSADGTMTMADTLFIENPFYSGSIKLVTSYHGLWSLSDDTLTIRLAKSIDNIDLDTTGIRYPVKFADSVRHYYESYGKRMQDYCLKLKQDTSYSEMPVLVRLNGSGNKMEMYYVNDEDVSSTGYAIYAVRR